METARDLAYEFCLRFFADLRACGVSHCVVSPGSRSTPLALSAMAAGLQMTVHIDERVAAFHALGQAKASGVASVLVCTSGTAGANYLPAVIEANHAGIPMIVCTADRPPELRTWGAGQAVDQIHLFGSNVHWFHDVAVPGEVPVRHAGVLALRAATTALHQRGPVHLNWPLREPLAPLGALHPPDSSLAPVPPPGPSSGSTLLAGLADRCENGLIVVGPDSLGAVVAAEIISFAKAWGWPVVADPASGLRTDAAESLVVTTGDLLLASGSFTDQLGHCDVIVRVGSSPTSKAYRLWVEAQPPSKLILVSPGVEWADPTASVSGVVEGPLSGLFATDRAEPRSSPWANQWQEAERVAATASEAFLTEDDSELGLARSLLDWLAGFVGPVSLMVSNSMPIRTLDVAMRAAGERVTIFANRGANGIDGVIATAGGIAQSTREHTVVFIGDVATVHDLGGLAAAARLGLTNLTVVVVDNNAGGIFSFLPVASVIQEQTFEQLFATPHGTDLGAVAAALGFDVFDLDRTSAFPSAAQLGEGPNLVIVHTSAADTVSAMAALRDSVSTALARR